MNMEHQIAKLNQTRDYLKLGLRYTSDVEVKASRMKERCLTLKRDEKDPMLYYAYEGVALLCEFIQEGYRICLKNRVKADEMLEELLDLYLQAGGYTDPLVKYHMPLLREKLHHPLKETLRVHLAFNPTKDGAYHVFYRLVVQTLNFIFYEHLTIPSVA